MLRRRLHYYSELASDLSELESPVREQLASDVIQGLGLIRACFWVNLCRLVTLGQSMVPSCFRQDRKSRR
jgi:hypothetical protein